MRSIRAADLAVMRVMAIGTVLLTLAAYAPALHGEFLFDGVSEIRENSAIRTLWPLQRPMFEGGRLPHRPLPYLSFAVNYRLHGLEPLGFHLTNLVIHVLNGLLATAVVGLILRASRPQAVQQEGGPSPWLVSWIIVTLWLVHPLCTQAVSYVYQRMELMAATAILAALFCHLRSQHGWSYWAGLSLAASGLGMACKETAVVIPPLLILTSWLVIERPADDTTLSRWRLLPAVLWRRRWYWLGHFAMWGLVLAIVLGQRSRFGELAAPRWSPLEYLANQPRSLERYLALAFWPRGQCLDPNWGSLSLPEQWRELVPGVAACTGLVVAFLACLSRAPTAAFAIGSFLMLLAPTSTVLPVNDLCMEHRMYLPLLPLVALTVGVLATRLWAAGRSWSAGPFVGIATTLGLLLVLAGVTWSRNHVYASGIAMWSDVLAKQPTSGRAAINLATAFIDAGLEAEAIDVCRRRLAAKPALATTDRANLHLVCGRALAAIGAPTEAVGEIAESIQLNPKNPEAFLEQGYCLVGRDPAAAAAAFQQVLTLQPGHAAALNNLAGLLAGRQPEEALQLMRRAIASEPENVEYRCNAGRLLQGLGRHDEAAAMFRSAAVWARTPAQQRQLRRAVPEGSS